VIRVEDRGTTQLVVIDRPEKLNALTLEGARQLRDRLAAASGDRKVRAVIITGEGTSFSSGVDLHEFADGSPETGLTLIETLKDLCAEARTSPKPVVCAIRGHCLGGALELALASDLRVCTPDASFGMPEVAVGLPSVIDAALLVPYVGLGRARELVLTGDPIGAEQALAWGLVNRVVSSEQLLDEALALAERVSRHHPSTVRAQKELIEDWLNEPLQDAIDGSVGFLVEAFRDGLPQRTARELLGRRKRS
jgi:enoyl-CoA hydratase/carnithine racemase